MTEHEEWLEKLTEKVNRVHGLLAKPEPGLMTWWFALKSSMDDLTAWASEEDDAGTE
ncbi:MAG: hypothetical protein IT335_04220 [Thermomicrobiales bacterium]|nr:hypothetical protein [Thermomicrobiales bacterium]